MSNTEKAGNERLTEGELEELEKLFKLSEAGAGVNETALPVAELLDSQNCSGFLRDLTHRLHAPSSAVAASQFAKRYAALLVVPYLYMLSVHDKRLTAPLQDVKLLEADPSGQAWKPRVWLPDIRQTATLDGDRDLRYREAVQALFAGHLAPLWASLAQASGVSSLILWENTAVRIYSLFEKRLAKLEVPEERKTRFRDDFAILLACEPQWTFGLSYQPLVRFYSGGRSKKAAGTEETGAKTTGASGVHLIIEDAASAALTESAPAIRIRRTCCLYYTITSPPAYCDACPLHEGNRR